MKRSPIASAFLAGLSCLLLDPVAPALAFQEIPVYEFNPISQLFSEHFPAIGRVIRSKPLETRVPPRWSSNSHFSRCWSR